MCTYVRTRIGVRCLDICGAMSHGAPRRNRLLPTRLGTSPGVRFSASSQQGLSGCADVHEVSPLPHFVSRAMSGTLVQPF